MATYIQKIRDAELPALQRAADLAETIDFPDKKMLLPELRQQIKSFLALETESWEAFSKPLASRRDALSKEYMDVATGLLDTLDKTSSRMFASVKFSDPAHSSTVTSTKPIATSYDTICAAERSAPKKA